MYEMKPEYYIGIDMIDEEHKQLFEYADEAYKKLFTQKIQHHEFIQKLDEFMEHHNDDAEDQDEQIMEILKYLTEWLVNHILYVDGQIPQN